MGSSSFNNTSIGSFKFKTSSFFKNYLKRRSSLVFKKKSVDFLAVQLSFSSNKEPLIVRALVNNINSSNNNCSLLGFSFVAQSASNNFGVSSFNYILYSESKLVLFSLIDQLNRLNINFLITAENLLTGENKNLIKKNYLFSTSLIKSFGHRKFLVSNLFQAEFGRTFLIFLKKLEFFNKIRLMKFLSFFDKKVIFHKKT